MGQVLKAVESLLDSVGAAGHDSFCATLERALPHRSLVDDDVLQAGNKVLDFYQQQKSAAAARHTGNIGKLIPALRADAIDVLGGFLENADIDEAVRRTATVELGSIAKKASDSLTRYSPDMDNSEDAQLVLNALGMLEKGVFPQVSRAIDSIVMQTKSPMVTKKGLEILLRAPDDDSADILDGLLDTKEGYVLQKLHALKNAVVNTGVENINPKAIDSIVAYVAAITPYVSQRVTKDTEELGLISQAFRVLAKHGVYPSEDARAFRDVYHGLKDGLQNSGIFDFSQLDTEEPEPESAPNPADGVR